MAELDEILNEYRPDEDKGEGSGKLKEEWQIKREQSRTEAFDMLESATVKLSDPAALATYFDVQSRFDRYSVSNALLVAAQRPSATRLADFKFWQSHEASIKKGEHAITILEPREYTKPDGTKGISYDPKRVFDISQTTMEQKSRPAKPFDEKLLIKALTKTSPVKMLIDNDLPEGVNAKFSPESGTIGVRQGMTGSEIFRALSQEIIKARAAADDRPTGTFETAAVCYLLCRRHHIDPPALPDKTPFEGIEPKDVRAMLKGIRDEANNMSAVMSRTLSPKNRDAR